MAGTSQQNKRFLEECQYNATELIAVMDAFKGIKMQWDKQMTTLTDQDVQDELGSDYTKVMFANYINALNAVDTTLLGGLYEYLYGILNKT